MTCFDFRRRWADVARLLAIGAIAASCGAAPSTPVATLDTPPPSATASPPRSLPLPSPTAPAIGDVVVAADFGEDSARPVLAVDPVRDRAYVAWTTFPNDTEAVSYLAASSDGGRTWGAPVQIPGRGEFWPVLRVTDDGTLVVAWTHWQLDTLLDPKDPYSNAAWTWVARSTDGGRSLSTPVQVESGRPKVAHYYLNLAISPDGQTITTSWFDYTPFSIPSLPQPGREAVAMWAATSTDAGVTFGAPALINADTCVCCMESGVVMDGHPAFVFRDWTSGGAEGDLRNPAIVMSTDQGQTWAPRTVIHDDGFHFPVCPHVGFGAVVDQNGRLHVSWWTGTPGRAGYWYATSDDGRTFSEPVLLATQVEDPHENDAAIGVDLVGTVWAATTDPGAVAADGSSDPTAARVSVWSIDGSGKPTPVDGATVSGRFPQVAGTAAGALVTWVDPTDQLVARRIGS
jgi:hypothetical protein